MTPEQQRIKIAEVRGWNPSPLSKGKWCHDSNLSMAKNGAYSVWVGIDSLPNYLNDLNAMHDAESALNLNQWDAYESHLKSITAQAGIYSPIRAAAAQRAEAFLRTLSLWTEE
jgi:hypothetical protein